MSSRDSAFCGAGDEQVIAVENNVLQPGGRAATLIHVRRRGSELRNLLIGEQLAGRVKDGRSNDRAGQGCLSLMPAERAVIARAVRLGWRFR